MRDVVNHTRWRAVQIHLPLLKPAPTAVTAHAVQTAHHDIVFCYINSGVAELLVDLSEQATVI